MSVTYNTTENNSVQYSTSGEKCLDLFARIGAFRNWDPKQVQEEFKAAFDENNKLATQILFWARAARLGAGERDTFHHIFCWYKHESHQFVADNAKTLAELGYWKDLLPYFIVDGVVEVFAKAISDGDRLACKWAPRKGEHARKLRDACGFTNKGYRQWLKKHSETVENTMSNQQWNAITYSSVPGAAMRKYKKAFDKHDADRFTSWKEDKDSKAAMSASYPHDVIKSVAGDMEWGTGAAGDADWALAQKQWDNLPNFIKEGENILPLSDVSGSMSGLPMLVSISLGMYLANRNTGTFHNKFMTFSENPQIVRLKGTLEEQFNTVSQADWGYNTDFEKCYTKILEDALSVQASPKDMPTMLLVLSDMQFDEADGGNMHLQNIRKQYREAGYVMPKLVFWNLRASTCAGSPATSHDDGVALVSGFSPVLMKAVLAVEDFNPVDVMREALSAIELDFTNLPEVYRIELSNNKPDPETAVFDGPESIIDDNLFNDDTDEEWMDYQEEHFS